MAEHLEQFERRLRARGLQVTRQRRTIVDHVFRHLGHFDVLELLSSLDRRDVKVSRATVYRTLEQLVATGLVRRHDLGTGRTVYEADFGRPHHEHLLCIRCGDLLEFVEPEIERLQDEVCGRLGFRAERHTLQIHGVCARCQQPRGAAEPRAASATATGDDRHG